MGAMPGNRERKDCQTDLKGVRDRARKQTQCGGDRNRTDGTFNENQATERTPKMLKYKGLAKRRALVERPCYCHNWLSS